MNVRGEVEQFIRNAFYVESETIEPSASFIETGIIDSTGVLELVGFLETRFGIKVATREMVLDNLDSLEKIESFVARKTSTPAV